MSAPARPLRILVTGSTGLLGRTLCPALAARGHIVLSHSRSASSASVAFPLLPGHELERAVLALRPDWIIHAAALTDLDACERDPAAARLLHVAAPASLAFAASRLGARFLYVSTDSVYPGDPASAPRPESTPPAPVNTYARTKAEGEAACLQFPDTSLVARVNFFGLHPDRPVGLAAWILRRLAEGRPFSGFTDVWFNPLHTSALADLLALAIEARLSAGTYNFGASDACSKHDFARRLALRVGADPALVLPATLASAGLPTPRPLRTVMDTRRLAAALGRPLPTIDEGLDALLATLPAPAV
ncbi:MAG: SDR family oxidoreductase [Opitutaceae bacterium]|nr:SDR family oxidoreductase [Opitutaceae bacterium]